MAKRTQKTADVKENTIFDDLQTQVQNVDNVVDMQKFIGDLREVEGLAMTRLSSLITEEGAPK
jgi:hypothetical protein